MFAAIRAKAGYNLGRGLVAALQAIADNFGLLEPAVRTSAAADYIPVIGDRIIRRTNAGAQTLTVAPNATQPFDIGHQIRVIQDGAGALTIVAGAAVTINKLATKTLVCAGQNGVVVLTKTATNVWNVAGDLTLV